MRGLAAATLASAVGVGLVGITVVASAVSFLGGAPSGPPASAEATASITPALLSLYQEASATCPGLPWTVLAAIGTIESDNGRSDLPGVHSGANSAGAEGPMQFEPATFGAYDLPVPAGGAIPPSPYDPVDAVYAAARLLCANGAAGGADLAAAVFAYNHSRTYVADVLGLAQSLGGQPAGAATTGVTAAAGAGAEAVSWSLGQIGTPYVWGAETPGAGFDCSGLVQAAYRVAGVTLPRVAQEQYDATVELGPGAPLAPGDLVFFGSGPTSIDHVGLFVGIVDGEDVMVDAPHSGAEVRAEPFEEAVGASFGGLRFVGATRP